MKIRHWFKLLAHLLVLSLSKIVGRTVCRLDSARALEAAATTLLTRFISEPILSHREETTQDTRWW